MGPIAWAALWGPAFPTAYAVVTFLRGKTPTVFIPDGRQRIPPLLLAAVSNLIGVWHLGEMDAPVYLSLLLTAYAFVALLAAVVSPWSLVSLHAAGIVVPWWVGVEMIGPGFVWWVFVPVVVGWCRIRRGDHSVAQVVAGAAIGFVASWCALTLGHHTGKLF